MKTEHWLTSLSNNQYLTSKHTNIYFVRTDVVITLGITVMFTAECNVMQPVKWVTTLLRNILPPSSSQESRFIQNIGTLPPNNMA
jgi:hypothetical protein